MADPFIPDNVAPDLAPLYNWLAPDPNRQYGTMPWSPWSFNPEGSPAWVQNGPDTRFAMPAILRDALAGVLDLANSTHSGALTNRGIGTLMSGGAGAGGTLAEKGALAAGGGRWWERPDISLPMDEASRAARATALGFDRSPWLFHGTAGTDFPGFSVRPPVPALTRGSLEWPGLWASTNPDVAAEFALLRAKGTANPPRILPLVARSDKPANLDLPDRYHPDDIARTLQDAFLSGYDAIRLRNYTSDGGLRNQTIWTFRDPSQLRSPFAVFDPAKRDSSDLLAARTSIPGFRPIPTTPGFRPQPNDPAGLPDYLRMMKREQEEREY